MRKNISLEVISSYPKLLQSFNKQTLNGESSLYLYQNEVYKILNVALREQRENLIIESLKHKLNGVVTINDLLYDDGCFVGYTMPLLNDLTIKELFGKLLLKEKCEIIFMMSRIFLDLYYEGFVYLDFHCSNIMVQKRGLLFLDRDGMVLKSDLNEENMYWIINFFWSIVISLLYDEDYSLNGKALDTLEILELKDISYDLSFFEEKNILRVLIILESKKDLFYQESKMQVRSLLKY